MNSEKLTVQDNMHTHWMFMVATFLTFITERRQYSFQPWLQGPTRTESMHDQIVGMMLYVLSATYLVQCILCSTLVPLNALDALLRGHSLASSTRCRNATTYDIESICLDSICIVGYSLCYLSCATS